MRIRRRLVLYAAVVAFGGIIVYTLLLSALLNGSLSENQDLSLQKLCDVTVAQMNGLPASAPVPGSPLLQDDLSTSIEAFVEVLDSNGTVLYSTGRLDGTPPRVPDYKLLEATETGSFKSTIDMGGHTFRVIAGKWSNGKSSGLVIAGQSTQYLVRQSNDLGGFLVLYGLLALLAVVIVSWLVVGRALRPLRLLARTSSEIGETGDLTRRLPAVKTRDEVGVLTASFNGMLEQLASAQNELAAALAGQRRFVADASHELRTPLTTIRVNAEFLAENQAASETDRREALADIVSESARMSQLIDDLLLLARADAGAAVTKRPVDVGGLANEVARKASRRGRPVKANVVGAIVEADPEAMNRLLWILVDNALRHGAGIVEVNVAEDGPSVVVTVTDQGPGIPEAELPHIFDRFYRADAARSEPGFGLGLAIARVIVESHSGSIAASNRPTGGAEIRVVLPAGA
jgi:two-component system OmpR family sensor kinase